MHPARARGSGTERLVVAIALVMLIPSAAPAAAGLAPAEPGQPSGDTGPAVPAQHPGDWQRSLLEQARAAQGTGDAVALANQAAAQKLARLDVAPAEPLPPPEHASPSQALAELADRYGATPGPDVQTQLEALDRLPDPLAEELTRFVDAFLALDTAARRAVADADVATLSTLADHHASRGAPIPASELPGPHPAEQLSPAPAQVLATRAPFLEQAAELSARLQDAPALEGLHAASAIQVAPAFSLDLLGEGNTYTQDYALVLDAGGDDEHYNNAGGSHTGGGTQITGGCPLFSTSEIPGAALVDLGGDDAYGDPANPRPCGVNGAGYVGVGMLLDAQGNDVYTADYYGANGGGYVGGIGLLLDVDGRDVYTPEGIGTNGGGSVGGIGFLLDLAGDDAYTAEWGGSNGGASLGAGFLLDGRGHDTYRATDSGVNGGGVLLGDGTLLDGTGDDAYHAYGCGANGGGAVAECWGIFGVLVGNAAGRLVDAGGTDTYRDLDTDCTDCSRVPKGPLGAQVDV